MFSSYDNWTTLWAFGLFFLFIGILLLYYFAQYNLLRAVNPENRFIPPGYVFLQIIPLFGSIYAFSVNAKIADSVRLEIDNREMLTGNEEDLLSDINIISKPILFIEEYRPTYEAGRTKCILGVCRFIPIIGSLVTFVWFVFLIIYWVKVVKVKNLIQVS